MSDTTGKGVTDADRIIANREAQNLGHLPLHVIRRTLVLYLEGRNDLTAKPEAVASDFMKRTYAWRGWEE